MSSNQTDFSVRPAYSLASCSSAVLPPLHRTAGFYLKKSRLSIPLSLFFCDSQMLMPFFVNNNLYFPALPKVLGKFVPTDSGGEALFTPEPQVPARCINRLRGVSTVCVVPSSAATCGTDAFRCENHHGAGGTGNLYCKKLEPCADQ